MRKSRNSELCKSGNPPNSPEMFRGGEIAGTMPELGGMFRPQKFIDRTDQICSATKDLFDNATGGTSDSDLTSGHKRMAGMA
jgi:hypothetical protein